MIIGGRHSGEIDSSYLKFIELEHEEILKTKWLISERLGRDCGMDYAIWEWTMRWRHIWIRKMREEGKYPLG